MRISSRAAGAATLALCVAGVGVSAVSVAARADEFLPPTVRQFEFCGMGPLGGCARFQGYIYVQRSELGEAPAVAVDDRSAATLGAERLYIHVGSRAAR